MKKILYLIATIILCNNVIAQEDKAVKAQLKKKYNSVIYWGSKGYVVYADMSHKGVVGAYDSKGNEVIPPIYDEIHPEDNCYKVELNKKTGILDKSGKELIPCLYSHIKTDREKDGFFEVNNGGIEINTSFIRGGKWGCVNMQGKVIIPIEYDYINCCLSSHKLIVNKGGRNIEDLSRFLDDQILIGGKSGVMDFAGKVIIPMEYDAMSQCPSENLIVVAKGGKWGFVDTVGKIVVPIEYESVTNFKDGAAKVKKNGQYAMIPNPLTVKNVAASGKAKKGGATSNYPAPNSDIDKDIPQNTAKSENTFAFIIANENYHSEPIVPYALNDGWIFKEYCLKTLGLPAKNVRIFEDASLGKLITCVEQITEIAKAYDGDANIIFYYAGHGVPDEKKSTAYLLPIDGSGSDIATTGYSLEKLYAEINKVPTKSVTVFLDACFSGAKREDEMLASARSVAIKVKSEAPKGNMVVFSAATGDETAHQYPEKGHGLFTYFLLKKLQETKGSVTYGELSDYVTKQVKRQSVVINNKRQTPTVIPSVALGEKWVGMKLK